MRVLAVDDERLSLNTLVKALGDVDRDIEVAAFQSVKEALKYVEQNDCDAAFLDIAMREMGGIDFAKAIKQISPHTYIVFVTGYSEFAVEAFQLHAMGYLLKPVNADLIREQLDYMGSVHIVSSGKKFRVQTFGNFEFFVDGKSRVFPCAKSKELLAYLVDRKGAAVSISEAAAVMFEDSKNENSAKKGVRYALSELNKVFREIGAENLLIKQRSTVALDVTQLSCDYYLLLDGDINALNAYTGEYMLQYSWGEVTLGGINNGENE